jgi:hypothetical protein
MDLHLVFLAETTSHDVQEVSCILYLSKLSL